MITQELYDQQSFTSNGFWEPVEEKPLYRVPPDFVNQQDLLQLQGKILTYLHGVKKRTGVTIFDLVNTHCMISYGTYKKVMGGRWPSRQFVAQLAVGLKLSVEEANELFLLQGGTLNLTNDADFITYHALLSQDAIEDYLDELEHYLGPDA